MLPVLLAQTIQKPPKPPPMSLEGWVVCITVLLMALAVAWYVISRIRSMIFDEPAGPDAYLGSFSELREQGLLEETEFQRLRKALAKETLAREAGDSTAGETTTEQTTSEQTASDAGEDTLGGDPAENTPDAENRSAGPENPVDESGNRERI